MILVVVVSAIKDAVGSADFLDDVGENINESNTDLDLADSFDTQIRHSFQRVEVSTKGIGFWGLLFVIWGQTLKLSYWLPPKAYIHKVNLPI